MDLRISKLTILEMFSLKIYRNIYYSFIKENTYFVSPCNNLSYKYFQSDFSTLKDIYRLQLKINFIKNFVCTGNLLQPKRTPANAMVGLVKQECLGEL